MLKTVNLRDLRNTSRMTQEEVALKLGVKRSTVAKWDLGLTFPRPETAAKLAELYGVTLDQLYAAWQESKAVS